MKIWVFLMMFLLVIPAHATQNDRFVSKIKHPTGKTIVVAEGEFEARSIGSFSVRLYDAAESMDETTFFSSGFIRARDGAIEKLILADVDEDEKQELIVVVRSVGTGNYLSAHTFSVSENKLAFRSVVEGLAADDDPVTAVKLNIKR